MAFLVNSEASKSHPKLVDFLSIVDATKHGSYLTKQELLRNPKLFRLSSAFMVLKWTQDKNDFHYDYWGSLLAEMYGMEQSGKMLMDDYHGENVENEFFRLHKSVYDTGEPVYIGGNFHWRKKEYTIWHQVTLPLGDANGKIYATLTYMVFDIP